MSKRNVKEVGVCALLLACALTLSACYGGFSHVHVFDEWTVTRNATCTEAGEKERYCSCGEKQVAVVAMTGHNFGEWVTTHFSTCTETGLQVRTCVCGEKQEQILAAQHDFIENIIVSTTCETEGKSVLTCTACGYSFEKTENAFGHAWQEATCTACQICQRCQHEVGEPLGHDYQGGSCTRCGRTHTGEVTVSNELPESFKSNVFYDTRGSIDAVTCSFTGSTLTVVVDYHKTYDEKGNTAMTGFWFYITIYDKDNIPVASELLAVNNDGVVNQRMRVTYTTVLDPTQDYTITFSQYYL